jgi:hypothetical protein
MVKANQPTLHRQLKALPWRKVPVADHTHNRGHGRAETRRLQVTTVAGLDFPTPHRPAKHPPGPPTCRPALAHRDRLRGHQPTAVQAHPARLADWVRGHWGIEALHHLRDVTFAEDASQARTGAAPRVMASLRNLAIGILRSASCAPTVTATSPPRYAATPATPPESCPCWASPARKLKLRHVPKS